MARQIGRPAKNYRRRTPTRDPYDVVLVVCEGHKTEPAYFKGLCATFRLSNANIRVMPSSHGNDPVSVVRYAEDEYQKAKDYDRVYCVFDRNGHANFEEAVDRINRSPLARQGRLFAAHSVPCFELWVLMHFEYWAAPFHAAGGRSACDRAITEVRRHLPAYSKGFNAIYSLLEHLLNDAVTHGNRLENENERTGSDNPSTALHRLVAYLRDLRS